MAAPFKYSIDGEILEPGEACLPLPDDGLFRGDGVFEVLRLYDGRPFAFADHLDRMERSAAAIELEIDRAVLESEAASLIAEVSSDCLLRFVATRRGRRILTLEELPDHNPTIALATVTYSPTLILNGVKSLSYGANMQATRMAKAAGADEALFVRPDGVVLEPPTSTIFWATAAGQLRTPMLEAGVLDSITRRKVIERVDVEEGEFPLEDLLSAPEAFLASTTREIQPVASVGERVFPEAPGQATRIATEAFRLALAEAEE